MLSLVNFHNKIKHIDRPLIIWLSLISLTLISASVAETAESTIASTLFIYFIVLAKGRWVIDEFMGLKQAAKSVQYVVKSYFFTMSTIITATLIYAKFTTIY